MSDETKAIAKRPDKDLKRALDAVDISERIEAEQMARKRTEALAMGRALALAGLPYRRSSEREISREIRLGRDSWVSVTYRATTKAPLPFGEDRYVLAGIQHLAIEQGSPMVSFEDAGELLRMFNLGTSGAEYRRLRERLERLRGLVVEIKLSTGNSSPTRWSSLLLNADRLPTREQIRADLRDREAGQTRFEDLDNPYFVKLSNDWWSYLEEGGRNLLLVRLDLLRQFVSRPAGWDYLCFLTHRCGSAETESTVPHDVLMSLFKRREAEPDRQVIERLRRYHDEIMVATDGKLVASLEVVDIEKGRGRPKKLWGLKVGPSNQLIASGRNVLEMPESTE